MESGRLWSGCQVGSEAESCVSSGTVTVPSCLHLGYRPSIRQSLSGLQHGGGLGGSSDAPASSLSPGKLVPSGRGPPHRSEGEPLAPTDQPRPGRSPLQLPRCLSHHPVKQVLCLVLCCLLSHLLSPYESKPLILFTVVLMEFWKEGGITSL